MPSTRDDVAAAELPAAPVLGLAVDPDVAGEQDVLHLGAGRDGVDELEQLAEADGVLARAQRDGAHGDQCGPAGASTSPMRTVPGPEDGGPHGEQPVALAVDGLEHARCRGRCRRAAAGWS